MLDQKYSTPPPRGHPGYNPDLMVMDLAKLREDKEYKASIMNPYTAERRDVSENTPPRPKRFPKGGDFAPRGPRDCPRAKPEGNLEGNLLGLGGCIFRYIPPLGSVRIQYL